MATFHVVGKPILTILVFGSKVMHVLNNFQDTVQTTNTIVLVANIATKGVVMKKKPNLISHNLKFLVSMAKSSFLDLCDSSNKDNPSLHVVVHVYMNSQPTKEQPLSLDVLQATPFTNVVNSLKAMSLTPHACFELKSLDYNAITIEFVNCLPTKFNGDILFEFPPMCHSFGHFGQLQGMDKKYNGHAWCKL
jgi:hypothetical protein